jgi:hypothetical protein
MRALTWSSYRRLEAFYPVWLVVVEGDHPELDKTGRVDE